MRFRSWRHNFVGNFGVLLNGNFSCTFVHATCQNGKSVVVRIVAVPGHDVTVSCKNRSKIKIKSSASAADVVAASASGHAETCTNVTTQLTGCWGLGSGVFVEFRVAGAQRNN